MHGFVYFQWTAAAHDLMLLPSKAAYDACDFSSATTLAPLNAPANAATGTTSYYLPCGTTPGAVKYVACSVASHCASGGQKLTVRVSATEHALDTSTTPPTALLHSDSLARVMKLLGHRTDAATGYTFLDRGYETEAAAEVSLEMIWCLESHCPASAQDFDATATKASCLADVFNLGGFVSRKRPTPDFARAEGYYLTALSHDPSHCPTLGYLTELYLMRSNASAAAATALRLCGACGATSTIARQIQQSFASASPAVATWPCGAPSAPPPPLAPGSVLVHEVSTKFVLAGSPDTFDKLAFVTAFAQAAKVSQSAVRLDVSAGSVIVVATVTTPSASAASALTSTIATTLTSSPAAASSALGLTVLSVEPPSVAVVARSAAELEPGVLQQITGKESDAVPVAAIAGGAAGGVAAVLLLLLGCYRRRRRNGFTTPVAAKGAQGAAITKKTSTPVVAAQLEVGSTPSSMDVADLAPSLPPSPPPSARRTQSSRVAPQVV